MSWLSGVRDANDRVRDVEGRMADEVAARKAEGRAFTEDARFHELNGQMESALSDRRAAWLGRDPQQRDEAEAER